MPATALLDLASGELLHAAARHERRVSDMLGYFLDADAEARLAEGENPLVYAYAESAGPAESRQLLFGATILQPGRIGDEYFMTRGHFHAREEASEIYLTLRGEGK